MNVKIEGTDYAIRNTGYGWQVVRPVAGGGWFTVADGLSGREAAEREARRLAGAKSAKVYG